MSHQRFHANLTSLLIYGCVGHKYMLVLPGEDKIFFLCWLHNSIFNINAVLQIDQLKKLISEGKKSIRKINYIPRLILYRLNSKPNIAPGQEILLCINTKWNVNAPQWVWVLEGPLKGRVLICAKHLTMIRFNGLWVTAGDTLAGSRTGGCSPDYLGMTEPAWSHLQENNSLSGLTKSALFTQSDIMTRYKCRHHDLQSNQYFFFLDYFLWLLTVGSNKACGQSYWKNMLLIGRFGVS